MKNKVILPVRLDSYAGETSALEAHLFNDKEEYGGKSVPDDCMWAAVYIVNGKIDHSLTEYGYRSLEELLETYKNEEIIGLRENRKEAEQEARDIAEDVLEVLIDEDSVLLHIEGELNLPDGAIRNAYKTLQKARTGHGKAHGIDREEIFYSLSIEDIFAQAEEMGIPQKKLTPKAVKEIKNIIEDNTGRLNEIASEDIQGAISDVIKGA